ncbi:MAG: hypothetical protein BGO43_06435 [Gammaproteobacteria bacterium 39-13]|nr:hypothetical protein [Gammaproteobacteria bacterium]OJV90483.1 MAG: hypothetical protein BGO43_06435 [Gammaproteobacteria bacterium 39-13]
MAQVHSTSSKDVGDHNVTLRTHLSKEENVFDPYKFLHAGIKNPPWLSNPHFSEDWVALQQKFWQGYMEWISWQQHVMQENFQENMRLIMHSLQLSSDPNTFYRYMRFNWQKPYLNLGAQTLSSTRLMTRLMLESWCAWQKMFLHSSQSTQEKS